ncbi:hypothetical protein COW94_02985 [Candidatus Peregrinibacteria bacterium CG22_combo_CG10-13_8_21_14_all_44_10]|nr:MAG: hypothetical protein AUK45_04440 [Candidatus Peregrinibacteria bacterium CG2_30_44_17]PIP66205.1 MAG: hypothetical protein COW94_02985 [Candidatus Peregrinibacteria bacterium CG22_combo_CG10-13_8_21_14_all_44_10]PIX79499.1 MAG: hypothetical protein COZ35_03330 [Candidatus Peregrinibacteria bacterium CG_4_10_14_3_um_filter_44_21]PJB88580.1 MAG: hypothetical protein CO082_03965 [Candidatus Peregrinibacteria bacterium CG_4_9_14_0_8_um_filter_44_15]
MNGNTNVPRHQGYVERAREAVTEGLEGVQGRMRIAMLLAATSVLAAGCGNKNDGADMGSGGYEGEDTAQEGDPAEQYSSECNDGKDNDGNGLVDGEDYTCVDGDDGVEGGPCADGYDNNLNSWTDEQDPGCWADSSDSSTYDLTDMCEGQSGIQTTMEDCNDELDEADGGVREQN